MFYFQKAYRQEGKKKAGSCLYAQMPQTIQTVFAKELSKTQSDVSWERKEQIITVKIDERSNWYTMIATRGQGRLKKITSVSSV